MYSLSGWRKLTVTKSQGVSQPADQRTNMKENSCHQVPRANDDHTPTLLIKPLPLKTTTEVKLSLDWPHCQKICLKGSI